MDTINYGLDLEREANEQSEEDYIFGAGSPLCIALIPQDKRSEYLPVGEVQRGTQDFMDCATRAPINILEAKFTYLYKNKLLRTADEAWLLANGYVQDGRITFSDRFIAIKSGTNKNGNSLKAPLQAIHEFGLIPKSMFPASKSLSFNAYHNPRNVTRSMEKMGKEFLKHFGVMYERVYLDNFMGVIDDDMIDVALFAWGFPDEKGVYQKDLRDPNHAAVYYRNPRYQIFDNYIDTYDQDFIKNLAPDYLLMGYGYRISISENPESENPAQDSLIRKLILSLQEMLSNFGGLWK